MPGVEWWGVMVVIVDLCLVAHTLPLVKRGSEESCRRTVECLKQNKIVHLRTYQCYSANSQGGCDEGERLVVNRYDDCKATHCIDNKDAEGTPCPDGLIAYNGRCEINSSKTACEGEGKGMRLYVDLYGSVSCRCSLDHGYVEVNGTCCHEHFRGPCEIGEKLQRKTDTGEWECVQNTCNQGKIMWQDGRCYEVLTPPEDCKDEYDIKTKNGTETVNIGEGERVEDLLVVDCITHDEKATFENCAARSSGGLCLAKRKPPKGTKQKNISDLLL